MTYFLENINAETNRAKENMTLDMIEWQKRTYVTDPYYFVGGL